MTRTKKQNTIITYLAIFFTFTIVTTSTLIFFILAIKKHDVNANTKLITNEPKNYKYLMKEIDGKINIFQKNNTKPDLVLEKPTIFLPEFDRKILSDGIYVNTQKELNSLIEDYDD